MFGFKPLSLCFVTIFHLLNDTLFTLKILLAFPDQFHLLSTPSLDLSALLLFRTMKHHLGLLPILLVHFSLTLSTQIQVVLPLSHFEPTTLPSLHAIIDLFLMEFHVVMQHFVNKQLVDVGSWQTGFDEVACLVRPLPKSDSLEQGQVQGSKCWASRDA